MTGAPAALTKWTKCHQVAGSTLRSSLWVPLSLNLLVRVEPRACTTVEQGSSLSRSPGSSMATRNYDLGQCDEF